MSHRDDSTRRTSVDAAKLGDLAADAGIERVHVLAWRDLDDVEAGGSEQHAHQVCKAWAAAGIEVTARTSFAADHPPEATRDGYRVIRRAGRYLVFPRAVLAELDGAHGPRDALVEIWNGMPFFSPVWARGPKVTFLHHVHGAMWQMVLPPRLARAGIALERRIAPPLYRRSRIITLSESSKEDILDQLGFREDRVHVVPPGIDPRFRPAAPDIDSRRSPTPLVVAAGRLVPSKHVDQLVHAVADARRSVPDLSLAVTGDGYERGRVEAAVSAVDGHDWVSLEGHVPQEDLVELYRRAWLVASASTHEGWGMTLTEAAACGTPAVATDIAGHRDAVDDGGSGVLVRGGAELGPAIAALVVDDRRRRAMSEAALERASALTWTATATGIMGHLADEADRRRLRRRSRR